VTAVAALGPWQSLDFQEDWHYHTLYHELGDSVATVKADRALTVSVQQDHLDLATVPGINGAGSVDDRYAKLGRQARSRVHEGGIPIRERNRYTGTDYGALSGLKLDVGGREQVAAGVTRMSPPRQRQARIQPPDEHFDIALGPIARHWTILPRPAPGLRADHVPGS
jgi:hypothetical protein